MKHLPRVSALVVLGMLVGLSLFVASPVSAQTTEAKLTAGNGFAGDQFGISVSISGDTAVVGAYRDDVNGFDSGSAYVFEKPSGGWVDTIETAKLTASDAAVLDNFGFSVSIDGDTVVVGAPLDNHNSFIDAGSVYVFEKPIGGWADTIETAKLTASDGASVDSFGYSVSISGDTVVVGASGDDDNGGQSGSVYVFEKPIGGWVDTIETAKFTASDGASFDLFGVSVSISGDTAVVGALGHDDKGANSGSAYVFVRDGLGVWSQQKELLASDGAFNDAFGFSVSISGDTAVVGARSDDDKGTDSGSAYVFERDKNGVDNWGQQQKLLASGGVADDQFGYHVSISGDTAMVGAPQFFSGGSGSAYVFERDEGGAGNWGEVKKLTASDGAADDVFGYSVSISGDASGYTAVVGARDDDDAGTNSGSAYVYDSVTGAPMNNGFVQYASWDDTRDNNDGQMVIYPTQNLTTVNLFEETSTTSPIQISTAVLSVLAAPKGVPIVFGPLTSDFHFFKVESDKPVNVEMVTQDYTGLGDSSRFVLSDNGTYGGTVFYFFADKDASEKIWVINPGTTGSGLVTLERFDTVPLTYSIPVTSTPNIPVGGVFPAVPTATSGGFFRLTSDEPVLVWEGRLYEQNMAIGAAPDGSTIGNVIYAAVSEDTFVTTPFSTTLRVLGITGAQYDIFSNTGGVFSLVTSGTVAAGGVTTHGGLLEDRVYKIQAQDTSDRIQVQYTTNGPTPLSRGGGEMIPGRDGNVSTNPGTSFLLFAEDWYQDYIDVIMPEAGTNVTITGPTGGTHTSTVVDEVFHFDIPEFSAAGQGVYEITATKPVWVVIISRLGDQQGYFVWRGISADCPVPDLDGDGIVNAFDNCPTICNPSQADTGNPGTLNDGIGDACDGPGDRELYYGVAVSHGPNKVMDSVPSADDVHVPGCPVIWAGFDGVADTIAVVDDVQELPVGDANDCDPLPGLQSDTILDAPDNCPGVCNVSQDDTDLDGIGDACCPGIVPGTDYCISGNSTGHDYSWGFDDSGDGSVVLGEPRDLNAATPAAGSDASALAFAFADSIVDEGTYNLTSPLVNCFTILPATPSPGPLYVGEAGVAPICKVTASGCSYNPEIFCLASGSPGLTVSGSGADTDLDWTSLLMGSTYDVVRGDVGTLLANGGDFDLATAECVADNHVGNTLTFSGDPAAGEAFWFLVRGAHCGGGTYDTEGSAQAAPRDGGIAASGSGCP